MMFEEVHTYRQTYIHTYITYIHRVQKLKTCRMLQHVLAKMRCSKKKSEALNRGATKSL